MHKNTQSVILLQVLACILCDEKFGALDGRGEKEKEEKVERKEEQEVSKDDLLKHLLLQHNFVIADVQLIADFNKYIRSVIKPTL